MPQRRFIALALTSTLVLAACGASDDSDSTTGAATSDGSIVAVGEAPSPTAGGGIAGAIEVAAGAIDDADDVACTVDRQTLEAAVQSYEILNGALPTSEQQLLDAQMIRELSVRFEISAEGAIVAAPGSPCT